MDYHEQLFFLSNLNGCVQDCRTDQVRQSYSLHIHNYEIPTCNGHTCKFKPGLSCLIELTDQNHKGVVYSSLPVTFHKLPIKNGGYTITYKLNQSHSNANGTCV